ncbi:MAG: hypothetical protein ACSLFR_07570 [Solirubrobacteraceae bacterium]
MHEHRSEHTTADSGEQRRRDRLRQQTRLPGQRHRDVRPPVLGPEPNGADERARDDTDPERLTGARAKRDGLYQQGLRDEERIGRRRALQRTADEGREQNLDGQVDRQCEQCTPACREHACGDEAGGREEDQEDRLPDHSVLGNRPVELVGGVRADEQQHAAENPRHERERPTPQAHTGEGLPPGSPSALDEKQGGAERASEPTAEEHDVRRAPQRDILTEQSVPEIVQRKAEEREAPPRGEQQRSSGHTTEARHVNPGST